MGVIKNQALKSTIFLYSGIILGYLNTGLLAPHLLTQGQIGTINLLMSYSAVFMSFAGLGFNTTTVRMFPHFVGKKNDKTYNGFLFISLLVGTTGFLLFMLFYYPIKDLISAHNIEKSPDFVKYFFLIIPLTLFQLYYALLDSYNNMLYRSAFGLLLRDIIQRIIILAGLLLIFLKLLDFESYIYLYTAAICIPTILIIFHLIHHKDFYILPKLSFLKKSLVKTMVSVSSFGLVNTFSNIAVLRIDTIMVNHYLNTDATGVYTTTFFFGTLVLVPSRAIIKIAPSLISKAFKENDLETIKDIYNKSSINLLIIGTLVVVGLLINLDNIFEIIPESYSEGKYVIVFIALANLVKLAGGVNDSMILYSKYYRVHSFFIIILLLALIGTNALLIPDHGIVGAALASFISLLLYNLIKYIFIKVKYNLSPYNYKYIVVLALGFFLVLIIFFIPKVFFVWDILIRSAIAIILYVPVIYVFKISGDFNTLVDQSLGKIRSVISSIFREK